MSDRKWWHDELNVFIVACFIIATISFGVLYLWRSVSCSAMWQESGMQSKFGLLTGCLVQRPDGKWIPSSAYREMEK